MKQILKNSAKKTTGKQKKTMDNSAWYSTTNFTGTSKIALFTISTTTITATTTNNNSNIYNRNNNG